MTLLSVADTAQSVYPELIVGLPRLLESMIGSPMGFPFMMRMNFGPRGGVPDLPGAGPEDPLNALDVELIPDPDELRSFLFPSVHALVVDEAGIRFLSREAIPTLNPSTAVPIALAALVPSVQSAQQATLRAVDQ